MIRIRGLDKYYNRGRENEIHVINDLSVELPGRGITAIFGKSGCGKTTLLNVIGGLDGFSGGSVEIDGADLRRNTDDLRNRYIGYIFQNYNLNPAETVGENVADSLRLCGLRDEGEIGSRVAAALKNVGMEMFVNRTPDTLSGGQQQRVAIARAIVKNPRIILADEPTGNLDEDNTVMVMDLLRSIARDHLVLLVTHEENLVDYYCDTVIELSDGRITNVRSNGSTDGYRARNRNDIYLGELDKSSSSDGRTEIDYYGPEPDVPVKLRIVNRGGRLYLKVDSPGVHVLDETSEIRLREGRFEAEGKNGEETRVDMSALPPAGPENGERTGRLFTFRSSVKSGYRANFRNPSGAKNVKKPLILSVLSVFSLVMVIMTAVLGNSIRKVTDIDRSFDRKVVYLLTNDGKTASAVEAAVNDPSSRADGLSWKFGYVGDTDDSFYVTIGTFESFRGRYYSRLGEIETHGVMMPESALAGLGTAAGRTSGLGARECVITTAMADILLENSTISYVKGYRDLLGLVNDNLLADPVRIVGVADSDEPVFFLNEADYAEALIGSSGVPICRASSVYGVEAPAEGQCVIITGRKELLGGGEPQTVKVAGRELTVKQVISADEYYKIMSESGAYEKNYRYGFRGHAVILSDADLIRAATVLEDSDMYVISDYPEEYGYTSGERYGYLGTGRYAVLHTSDPSATEAYLRRMLPELGAEDSATDKLTTPGERRARLIAEVRSDIVSSLITIGSFAAVMCVCMFFMMRAALLSRIREIGIYRAIGTTKGNILFRFLTESAVLTALTVFVTFLLSSAGLIYLQAISRSFAQVVYYPVWLAAILAAFQWVLCLLCGTAPVMSLLSRTPSEILSKYDI
jgi:ABC-type lipoprotein export system ATPase subunit